MVHVPILFSFANPAASQGFIRLASFIRDPESAREDDWEEMKQNIE